MSGKISLPTLIQRVRVDTTSMTAAEKKANKFGDNFEKNADRVDESAGRMSGSIDDLNESLDTYGKRVDSASKDSDRLDKSMGEAEKSASNLGDSSEHAAVGVEHVGKESERSSRKVGGFRREVDKSHSSLGSFEKKLIKSGGGLRGLLKLFIGFKILKMGATFGAMGTAVAGLVGVIGQLVPVAAAAGAGLIAITGAAAPLLGVVGALPGALFALGGAFGVFKLATGQANAAASAIKKYGENSKQAKEALKGLSAEGRAYAKQLGRTSKQFDVLRKVGEKFTLPGLTKALKIITPLFNGPFRSIVKDIGTAIGDIAVGFAKFAITPEFQKSLTLMGKISADLLRTLAPLLPSVATAFTKIVIAAAPMTTMLAEFITRSLDWFNILDNDTLTKFFDNAGNVFIKTWSILGDFGRGLGNIISAATEGFGGQDGLLASMGGAASKFLGFTQSTKGRNGLVEYFEKVRPTADALGRLFGALGASLVRISTDPNTPKLIDSLTTNLLPTIEKIIKNVSKGLPGVLDLVNSVAGVFDGVPWGLIGKAAGWLGAMVGKVDDLISRFPVLAAAIAGAFALTQMIKWKRRFDALSPGIKQLLTGRKYAGGDGGVGGIGTGTGRGTGRGGGVGCGGCGGCGGACGGGGGGGGVGGGGKEKPRVKTRSKYNPLRYLPLRSNRAVVPEVVERPGGVIARASGRGGEAVAAGGVIARARGVVGKKPPVKGRAALKPGAKPGRLGLKAPKFKAGGAIGAAVTIGLLTGLIPLPDGVNNYLDRLPGIKDNNLDYTGETSIQSGLYRGGQNAAQGALYGSWLGPIGALVGGGAGFGITGLVEGNARRKNEQNKKKRKNNPLYGLAQNKGADTFRRRGLKVPPKETVVRGILPGSNFEAANGFPGFNRLPTSGIIPGLAQNQPSSTYTRRGLPVPGGTSGIGGGSGTTAFGLGSLATSGYVAGLSQNQGSSTYSRRGLPVPGGGASGFSPLSAGGPKPIGSLQTAGIGGGDLKSIGPSVQAAVAPVPGIITSTLASVPGKVTAALAGVNPAAVAAFNPLAGVATAALGAMTGATDTGLSPILSAFSGLGGSILSSIGDLSGSLFTAGANMMTGLLGGVQSLAGSVISTVGGVISGVVGAASNILDSHSPSRVFHGLGAGAMEGFKGGVEASRGLALTATTSAMSAIGSVPPPRLASSGVAAAPATVAAGAGNQTNNYTIQSRAMNERSLIRELRDVEARPLMGRPRK